MDTQDLIQLVETGHLSADELNEILRTPGNADDFLYEQYVSSELLNENDPITGAVLQAEE